MLLFQSLVALLFVASFLLAASRRIGLPYPTLLCLAGVGVALLPMMPTVSLEPRLVLALFIAPALLDAAFDLAPRDLRPLWVILLVLAVGAVLVTTAAVAAAGVLVAGLPLFAAIALGAIVAPPDAAAATAVLAQVDFPRRGGLVLQAEGLFNDATSLLVFGAATAAATRGMSGEGAIELALAAPGGVVLGVAAGWLFIRVKPLFDGLLSGIIVEFTATFGVWLLADRLHLSPVLAVASYAMMLARRMPALMSARDRVQSRAVWSAVVFVLNVLAFLLMGLQARAIFADLGPREFWRAGAFAGIVLALVIAVRIVSVLGYRAAAGFAYRHLDAPSWLPRPGKWRVSIAMSWCGMRGLLTLTTALALPDRFPGRNTIVLTAFAVVLGTLVLQGSTLGLLMRVLHVNGDATFARDLADVRTRILGIGITAAGDEDEAVGDVLRSQFEAATEITRSGDDPQAATPLDAGLARAVAAQRAALHDMRDRGDVADDIYRRLEEELDWLELAARPSHETAIGQA